MLYHAYEFTHAAISPFRQAARIGQDFLTNPLNPMAMLPGNRTAAAAFEMFINATRRYGKPEFEIDETEIDGVAAHVSERTVWARPFCNLVQFVRHGRAVRGRADPPVLIVAPMSGHYATLLRGTVKAMLPGHEVYVTDWVDAREVPLSDGRFDLDDYTDYLIEMIRFLANETGERPAVLGVCQPGVPLLVATSLMAADQDPARPSSFVLMGSPIDVTQNPKQPNRLAEEQPLSWFESNLIMTVPWPHRGFLRRVYPGFLQLTGFINMNPDRHWKAHLSQFRHLIQGDGDSAEQHRKFYDEYLAVMDLTQEFYLQTIDRVFQRKLLPLGEYRYRDRPVDPGAIADIAMMTVEGERDDITGLGQTEAAHGLTVNLPADKRLHYVAEKVGHYGVFNGSRFRANTQPRMAEFIAAHRA